ncbi:MAG TPA: hypothetical protein VEP69_04040, partial [Thermodesulfovibrionales bacterium]|nr:hypothetical protein [Thermodesulfovibrionales bacterium]
ELSGMKTKLLGFIEEIEAMRGPEKELVMSHISHLRDVIETIDWKLDIITRVCPTEWADSLNVETRASVEMTESLKEESVASGYIGG